jgi:hypothetical protein
VTITPTNLPSNFLLRRAARIPTRKSTESNLFSLIICDSSHYEPDHKDNYVLSPEASSAILKLDACEYLIPIKAALDCFDGEMRHGRRIGVDRDVELETRKRFVAVLALQIYINTKFHSIVPQAFHHKM